MATSSPPLTADPVPSPTTDTPLLPTGMPTPAAISATDWEPQPSLTMAVEELVAAGCIPSASAEYYFLDLGTRYELLDLRVDSNYSLTSLRLGGSYYLGGETVPESRPGSEPLTANFGGQDMALIWNANGRCAQFAFTFTPGSDTLSESSVRGPLLFTQLAPFAIPPRILISSANAILQLQSSPQATPTGGLDSTADSSIGQSTNQTAAPAAGNVPISSSSSSSSPKASVLAPAIVVPVVVILAALAGFFLWRRHRRARLAPSAAFRADHADAVEAMERQGATVGLGGTGTTQLPTAGVSLPAQSSSYFPLDEKRPLGP